MTARALLGIDLGAGSLKASIISENGDYLGGASAPITTHAAHPGWSEQIPADWWKALCTAVPKALVDADVDASSVVALSLSAGAHTCVLTDKSGGVIRPAIMWSDQRSFEQSAELRRSDDILIRNIAGNAVSPTWTLSHLHWLSRYEPGVKTKTHRLYMAKDWLRAQLTGDWFTDPIDALGTMMFDASARTWSKELCDRIGWSLDTLPPVVDSIAVTGRVHASAARACGLKEGTLVICGTSDTAAEALGAGMNRPGLGIVKLATAATLSTMTSAPSADQKLVSYYYFPDNYWYLITGTNSCASAHAWLRQTMFSSGGSAASFDQIDALAAKAPAGSEGLFFHPYLNGERSPYFDPKLRGDFVGLNFAHQPSHIARAFYEGIAFSLRDCQRVFEDSGVNFTTARITGGGSRSATWRQIVADVLNIQIELPAGADASYGIALIAGLGARVFDSVATLSDAIKVIDTTHPNPASHELYQKRFEIYREIQAALAPINHRICDLLAAGN